MDLIHERCGGLDVHLKSVVACRLTPGPDGQSEQAVRTFGTMTADREELAAWLAEAGCTHVALESTGVYWKPVWNVLEGRFTLLLVNARHVKAVPGRKTDVRDCEWLADLLRHGLLAGQLCPRSRPAGVAGAHPLSHGAGAGARHRGQSAAQDPRRREREAGRGGE